MQDEPFTVDLEPIGRRVEVAPGQTLLDGARQAGVGLVAVCGGAGVCGKCRVRLITGTLTDPTPLEQAHLSAEELAAGWRLACQAQPTSAVKLDIPPDSLTTPQRLQVEGEESSVPLDPAIVSADLTLSPPGLEDLRSDVTRLSETLVAQGLPAPQFGYPVLRTLSDQLRAQEWSGRMALRRIEGGHEVAGLLPAGSPLLGLALDLGTTKVAAYLLDLATGKTLAKAGIMNLQVAYGEDVVSRIAYTNDHEDGRQILQRKLVDGLNALASRLCTQVKATPAQIVEAIAVGNTAIHHLFAGLPVRQLGEAPYLAAVSEPLEFYARDLGLELAPGARIILPPIIAGYVGADHVAMLLATGAWKAERPTIALDIGTNTEISLTVNGTTLSCSCASGPAFEGAHILAGMRAAPGAIEAVRIHDGVVHVQTIDGKPPVGLCGSGILDAVAEMQAAGVLAPSGKLKDEDPRVRTEKGGSAFLLVPGTASGNKRDILITRQDVHEIQLAKAAIRAGVEVLLQEAGLTAQDIETFIVAGAFGTYLNLESAIRIGMFPPLPLERFQQVGNAAGTGARQMLLSVAQREAARALVEKVRYVELTTYPAFVDLYTSALML